MVELEQFLAQKKKYEAEILEQLISWSNINTGSYNLEGLGRLADLLCKAFLEISDTHQILLPSEYIKIDSNGHENRLTLGNTLSFRKRPEAPVQILFSIHYDTVFGPEHDFQSCKQSGDVLNGPGVLDAKAGIMIILQSLKLFEQTSVADKIGWQVLLNPDEEIGSPGSLKHLQEAAGDKHLALVYEPVLPNGDYVSSRKGSGNFTAVMRGKASHAGRNPEAGVNAMYYLSRLVVELTQMNDLRPGYTVNVAKIEGGGPFNIVPDLAIARFNIRLQSPSDIELTQNYFEAFKTYYNGVDNLSLDIHGQFFSPPKLFTDKDQFLADQISKINVSRGYEHAWQSTGGVCDGNKLAACGLAVIDTMGAHGNYLHSSDEYLRISSLCEKIETTTLFLHKLASGEIELPETFYQRREQENG